MSKTKEVPQATKLVEPQKDRSYCEIGQQNMTKFALARYDSQKDRIVQCHPFIKCRDFLLDAMVGVEEGKDMGIYGFEFKKTDPRPDAENTSLLVSFPQGKLLKNFQDNFSILTDIEKAIGWSPTYPELVNYPGKEQIVWVSGDRRWQHCALALSLYTYLIKCLTYEIKDKAKWMEEIKAQPTNEGSYMDVAYMSWLLPRLDKVIDKYTTFSGFQDQKGMDIGTIHNWTGFKSMMSLIGPTKKVDEYYKKMYKNHVLFEAKFA